MKVLVCGSRHFNDYDLLEKTLDGCTVTIDEIIHGAARGADTMGGTYAEKRGIPVTAFPAKWDEFGRSAGPIRNALMLKEGKPDLVVAFLFQDSRGTKNMVMLAKRAGVPVQEIWCDQASRVAGTL